MCQGEVELKCYSRDSFDYEEGFESECVSTFYDATTKQHSLR